MDGPATLERVAFPEGYENLSGRHARTLDDKFRVVLPAGSWRDLFAEGAKLTVWVDCLALWTRRSYLGVTAELLDRERRGELRHGIHTDFREDTVDVTPDGQGRFVLPADLRAQVGIGGKGAEVLVIGNGDRAEIWDRATREAHRAGRSPESLRDDLRNFHY